MSVKLHLGGTENNTGTINGSTYGVEIYGGTGMVTNSGTISASAEYSYGVLLEDGGTVGNQKTGVINGGYGIEITGAQGTVTNAGSITARGGKRGGPVYPAFGTGVYLKDGGKVTNSGLISAYANGVSISGEAGTVSNTGTIKVQGGYFGEGAYYSWLFGTGVSLAHGGSVNNTGIINGFAYGVFIGATNGTVDNAGTITAKGGRGFNALYDFYIPLGIGVSLTGSMANTGKISGYDIGVESSGAVVNSGAIESSSKYLSAGVWSWGAVTNEKGGNISSKRTGVYALGKSGSVTNAGTITGNYSSVQFTGSGANTLTLETGSVLNGAAAGSKAKGATNALVLQGVGTANNDFYDFNTLKVQASGDWRLGGDSTIGATTLSTGALIVAGQLTTTLTEANGFTLNVLKGGVLTLMKSSTFVGPIGGAGTLDLASSSSTIATGAMTPTIVNAGTLSVTNGLLDLKGALSGTGQDRMGASTTFEVDNSVSASQAFVYAPHGSELALDDLDVGGADLFKGAVSAFGAGDKFDAGAPFGVGTAFVYTENAAKTAGTLALTDGKLKASITFLGDYATANFTPETDGHGGTLFTFHA